MEKQTGRERGGRAGATDTHHYLSPCVIESVFPSSRPQPRSVFIQRPVRAAQASREGKEKPSNVNFSCLVTTNTFSCVSLPLRRDRTDLLNLEDINPLSFLYFHICLLSNVDTSGVEVSLQPPQSPNQLWETDRHKKKSRDSKGLNQETLFLPNNSPQSFTFSPALLLVDRTVYSAQPSVRPPVHPSILDPAEIKLASVIRGNLLISAPGVVIFILWVLQSLSRSAASGPPPSLSQ